MARPTPTQVIAAKTPNERVDLVMTKIRNVADRISGLLALAESNALIVYSPLLASQIPPSTAGHAFNTFQRAMHGFEIVQLCAIWDKADHSLAHNSIPVVHGLIDDDDVVAILVDNVRRNWPDRPVGDYARDELMPYFNRVREEEAGKALAAIAEMRALVSDTLDSSLLASVRNLRDRELAHTVGIDWWKGMVST